MWSFGNLKARKSRMLQISVIVVVMLAMLTGTTYAILRTINVDDTLLDANWQGTPYISADPEESLTGGTNPLPTDMDIQNAWLASDATSIYFRIQIYNEVQAFTGVTREAWAQLDCDLNGSINDAADRWVIYQFHLDDSTGTVANTVYIRSGNSGFPIAAYNDNYGERPIAAVDDDNIEWRVDQTNLPADCINDIRVQFHTDNLNDNNDDTTVLGPTFGVPTAIALQSIDGNNVVDWLPLVSVVILGFVSVGVIFSRKRQHPG